MCFSFVWLRPSAPGSFPPCPASMMMSGFLRIVVFCAGVLGNFRTGMGGGASSDFSSVSSVSVSFVFGVAGIGEFGFPSWTSNTRRY